MILFVLGGVSMLRVAWGSIVVPVDPAGGGFVGIGSLDRGLLRGRASRRISTCGIQGHLSTSVEGKIEGAFAEVGSGGGGRAVDIDTLGGW